jgi:hypothetical protein
MFFQFGWLTSFIYNSDDHRIKVIFRDAKGTTETVVEGNEGDDLLSLAHEWDVDLEGESVSSRARA